MREWYVLDKIFFHNSTCEWYVGIWEYFCITKSSPVKTLCILITLQSLPLFTILLQKVRPAVLAAIIEKARMQQQVTFGLYLQ